MLTAALRLALRRLARRPGTTALHVGGLAVGLACCFLAVLDVRDEQSYDRFHPAADRIFQLHEEHTFGDQTVSMLNTRGEGVEALRTRVPGVEAVAVIDGGGGVASVRRVDGGTALDLEDVVFAEPSFFQVFAFPLVSGDTRTALAEPNRVVLTETTARRLFGDADPVGRGVIVERTSFEGTPAPLELEVAGVAADPPATSSITFTALVSGATPLTDPGGTASPALAHGGTTYVRLRTAGDTTAVQEALARIATSPEAAAHSFGEFSRIGTTPLTALHTQWHGADGMTGQPLYLVLFSAVAALILLLACINYANLATALSLRRGTEVGVRKAVGAGRGQLTRQFLTEALLLAALAGIAAAGLVAFALPAFNGFFGKGVGLTSVDAPLVGAALALTVLAGLIAGAYPAFVLARFRPAAVLKGQVASGRGGALLRQSLVVVQFAVTAVLLAGTAVVWGQLRYARTGDLGFDGDQALVLDLETPGIVAQRDVLKRAMEALPGVSHASLSTGVPGDFGMIFSLSPEETPDDPSDDVQTQFSQADAAYADALGLHLVAGRWLTDEGPSGEPAPGALPVGDVVLNETAARRLGLMTTDAQTAVGRQLANYEVVGVVRDFNYTGLRAEIGPFAFMPFGEQVPHARLVLKLDGDDIPGALDAVRAAWTQTAPTYPFEARFVDERFAERMREDEQLGQLFGAFGGVAVVLACLGMLGLAAHAAERRTKEVGVRKVLGARVIGLVALLSAEFVRLVLIALAVATPVTVLLARRWLEGFAFRAPLSPLPFVAIALGVLALALAAVSVHAVRAATADPVRSLRYE